MFHLQEIQGFFPTIINGIYYYDKDVDIDKAIRNSERVPHVKESIIKHYSAVKRIAEILYEVNQYLILLETLEIEGNIAFIAQGMIYGDSSGPTTEGGHKLKLDELANMFDTAILFLKDVEKVAPGLLGERHLGLEETLDIVDSFHNNYSDLKDYLERVI